jgi:hypothetical protein
VLAEMNPPEGIGSRTVVDAYDIVQRLRVSWAMC